MGAVLLEHSTYDDDGQFLAATFMDYLLPTSVEVPPIEIEHLEIPNGDEIPFRGVGEGGAIAAPPAVNSAIEDALSHPGSASPSSTCRRRESWNWWGRFNPET